MSDSEYFEVKSDSFWEIGQFKRTVKRTEDSYKLCNDLMQMLSERASLEKLYSKSLRSWSKKWNDYLEKTPEYGTSKASWTGLTSEATAMSEIHLKIHDDIEEQLIADIKSWQKQNYPKTMMNTLKIVKQYEEEFTKAQKPWAKKYLYCDKAKKEYHNQCKQLQSARIQEANAKNDQAMTSEQRKKYEDKAEKCRKEVENAKHKYEQSLEDLNEYNPRYIEDMKTVYKKCDIFEKSRLEFFIQKLLQAHSCLDLTQKPQINQIYANLMQTIKSASPDKDLLYWSKNNGTSMAMNWPAFEEYSEELKSIGKVSRSSKLQSEDGGVTMTSIRQKDDQTSETSGFNSNESNNQLQQQQQHPQPPQTPNSASKHSHSESGNWDTAKSNESYSFDTWNKNNKSEEGNPFGDSDDENGDEKSGTPPHNNNNNHHYMNHNPDNPLNIKVRAVYDYDTSEADELPFKAGEEFIKLQNEDDRGWCLGQLNGRVGLYPATYALEV